MSGDGKTIDEAEKRRAVDDFLRSAVLKIPGTWTPVKSLEQYEAMIEKIEASRYRQTRIQVMRERYADEDGNVSGIRVGLVEQAAVALTVNGIKPPEELSDRQFLRYETVFEHLVRYLKKNE